MVPRLGNGVLLTVVLAWMTSSTVKAQIHSDVLLQDVDGKVMTGAADFTNFAFTLGSRVYRRDFDENFEANNPGFNVFSNESPFLPPGSVALPPGADVGWDYLPMTVGTTVANLMYWDGSDLGGGGLSIDDVDFGLPADASWSILGENAKAKVFGTPDVVPGDVIGEVEFDGTLHEHLLFELDADGGGNPAEGIYMIGMRVNVPNLESSLPFVILMRTFNVTEEQLDVAEEWVEANLDARGDYNGNGTVDSADYAVWLENLGSSGPVGAVAGDGTSDDLLGVPDGDVDLFDYQLWKTNLGRSGLFANLPEAALATSSNSNIPEPSGAVLMLALLFLGCALRFARLRILHGSEYRT